MSSGVSERAGRLAASLAEDAAERDAHPGGAEPEVIKLRESGLLAAAAPTEVGGEGRPFAEAFRALRLVAAQDNATAMLLGYHWVVLRTALVSGHSPAALAGGLARGAYLAGVTNARDADLLLASDGDELRLDGRRTFCTGARVADLLYVHAVLDGTAASLLIPASRTGIQAADDWDAFGERGSESGSVTFTGVRVAASEIVMGGGDPTPEQTLSAPLIQLLFVNLYLGAAEGALADAVGYVRRSARPWPGSGVTRAGEDPYVLATVGTMHADLRGARALADEAGAEMDAALARGPELGARQRGEAAVTVSAAKLQAVRVGLDVTSRAFEVMGARATGRRHGYDRRWRDLRVHTLHDPVAYKAREVGAHVVDGALPAPSNYA